jgi:hypothetical protein
MKEKKRFQRHTETPMVTLSVLLERYRQEESNDTKKVIKNDRSEPHKWYKGM